MNDNYLGYAVELDLATDIKHGLPVVSVEDILFHKIDPPHYILWFIEDRSAIELVASVNEMLPEVLHVFYTRKPSEVANWVGDVAEVVLGSDDEGQIENVLSKICEKIHYYYLNKNYWNLKSETAVEPERFFESEKTVDEVMEVLFTSLPSDRPWIYFRYLPHYHSFLVFKTGELMSDDGDTLGVEAISEKDFDNDRFDLLEPISRKLLLGDELHFLPLKSGGEIRGVFATCENGFSENFSKSVKVAGLKLKVLELERKMHKFQNVDETTHLDLRPVFLQKLDDEISRSRRVNLPVAVMCVMADGFKSLCDKMDDSRVRLILKSLAQVIKRQVRGYDVIGYFGNGEFYIILPHTHCGGAKTVGTRICDMVQRSQFSRIDSSIERLTVSVTVGGYPESSADGMELISQVQDLLNSSEGNQVVMANSSVDDSGVELMSET